MSQSYIWAKVQVLAKIVCHLRILCKNWLTEFIWKKLKVLKVRKSQKKFLSRHFLQKMNEWILLYYYETLGQGLVFVCFLEEIEDIKETFRNYLTNWSWISKILISPDLGTLCHSNIYPYSNGSQIRKQYFDLWIDLNQKLLLRLIDLDLSTSYFIIIIYQVTLRKNELGVH